MLVDHATPRHASSKLTLLTQFMRIVDLMVVSTLRELCFESVYGKLRDRRADGPLGRRADGWWW